MYRGSLLYVPDGVARLQVLETCHDSPLAGHFGISKTMQLITRTYWWPQIRKDVRNFIRSCDICFRSKIPLHLPYGKLQPLPIPKAPWQSISMDFIIDLPPSSGYDAILVVVDRFTKMAHFLPCRKDFISEDIAKLLLQEVFRHHGLPQQIISDRGSQFIAKFWKRLFELLQVMCSLSSTHHQQTDGHRSVPFKHLNNIFGVLSIINKIIGPRYYHLQSLHTITLSILLQGSHHFSR